jgi:hypothetical protein
MSRRETVARLPPSPVHCFFRERKTSDSVRREPDSGWTAHAQARDSCVIAASGDANGAELWEIVELEDRDMWVGE